MDSQTTGWTKVGKGGKPVEFPPEAAAAFSSKKGRVQTMRTSAPSADFPEMASAAFGRRTRGSHGAEHVEFDATAASAFGRARPSASQDSSPPSAFDTTAAAAFGSKPRGARSGFDDRAAAAFGGGGASQGDFPSSFGKKRPGFSSAAADIGFDDAEADGKSWNLSAFGRKRVEVPKAAPPKKQTYEELFPVLGTAAATVAAPAPIAVPASATAPKPQWGGKASFADVMKKRVAIETAEAELMAREEREREELEAQLAYDRRIQHSLHKHRIGNTVVYGDDEEGAAEYAPHSNDLDVDGYGELRRELHAPEKREPISESESEEDDAGKPGHDDDYY